MPMVEIGDDGVARDAQWNRTEGRRALGRARLEARLGAESAKAEKLYRLAISRLVDAFLLDRQSCVDCFALAHVAGAEVNQLFGCEYEYDGAKRRYTLSCPIFALHAVAGTSIAWTLSVKCSICGAAPLTCEHIPGETYDGEDCVYEPDGVRQMDHIAWTPNPDFIYTFHQHPQKTAEELLRAGIIEAAGQAARCNHCLSCQGKFGPNPDDLDPVGRWERLLREHAPRD